MLFTALYFTIRSHRREPRKPLKSEYKKRKASASQCHRKRGKKRVIMQADERPKRIRMQQADYVTRTCAAIVKLRELSEQREGALLTFKSSALFTQLLFRLFSLIWWLSSSFTFFFSNLWTASLSSSWRHAYTCKSVSSFVSWPRCEVKGKVHIRIHWNIFSFFNTNANLKFV